MRSDKLALALVAVVFAAGGLALSGEAGPAGGKNEKTGKRFPSARLVGSEIATAKLVFDAGDADRSTPEAAARAFLRFMADTRSLGVALDKLLLGGERKVMAPVLTDACNKAVFETRAKGVVSRKKATFQIDIKFPTRKQNEDGTVLLSYSADSKTTEPCSSCDGSGKREGADCSRCKASGTYTRDRTRKGKLLLAKRKDAWLLKTVYRNCYSCSGNAKCRSCKGSGKSGEEDCKRCKGKGKCTICEATGMRKEEPFRMRVYSGLPKLALAAPDLANPKAAFASLASALGVRGAVRKTMTNMIVKDGKTFIAYFIFEPTPAKPREFKPNTYKLLELKEVSATEASVSYRKQYPGSETAATADARPTGWVKLKRDEKGLWRAAAFESTCWSCRGSGKSRIKPSGEGTKPAPCRTCKGSGRRSSTYLP